MIEFKPTEIEFKIGGESILVRRPKIEEAIGLEMSLQEVSGDSMATYQLTKDYLINLGFDKNALESLELEQYTQVLEAIKGEKKS